VVESRTMTLLTAVRTVDPGGRFAMAVVALPGATGEKPGLAVDSTRLARVANWPAGGPAAGTVQRVLRRPVAPSIGLRGSDFTGVGAVYFGRVRGAALRRISSTSLAITTPRHRAGTVAVRVLTNHGWSSNDRDKPLRPDPTGSAAG